MGISDATETNMLKLLFNATAWANVADDAATSPITNIQYALHSADPGDGGTQLTSEAAYTGYARVDVARSTSGHTVSGNSVSPAADITFPAGTGGGETVTHFSAGKDGTDEIFFSGTVSPNITTGDGITPKLTTATTITLD